MNKKMRPDMITGFQKKRWFQRPCFAHTGLYRCSLRASHTIETVGVHANFSTANKRPVYWINEFVYFEET